MKSGSATATAKYREPTKAELHIQKHHITIVFDEEDNRIKIGFSYAACANSPCPVPNPKPQPTVIFYACPRQPCPPGGR